MPSTAPLGQVSTQIQTYHLSGHLDVAGGEGNGTGERSLLGAVVKKRAGTGGGNRRGACAGKQFEVTHYWQLALLWVLTMLWVPKEIPCLGIIHQTLLNPYYVAGRMLSAGARYN